MIGAGWYHLPAELGPLYEFDGNLVADVLEEEVAYAYDEDDQIQILERTIRNTGKRAIAMPRSAT